MTDPRPAPQPDSPERAAEAVLAAGLLAPDPLDGADAYGWGV
ncbi:MAG: hypothetical protein WAS25_04920 [Geothrix sp.]